jgi:hypothetical protein
VTSPLSPTVEPEPTNDTNPIAIDPMSVSTDQLYYGAFGLSGYLDDIQTNFDVLYDTQSQYTVVPSAEKCKTCPASWFNENANSTILVNPDEHWEYTLGAWSGACEAM